MSLIYFLVLFGVLARVFSVILIIFSVLPKQWRELRIRNGLHLFRRALLLITILYLLEIIFPLFLGIGFLLSPRQITNHPLLFSFVIASSGDLTTSILLWVLYNRKIKMI